VRKLLPAGLGSVPFILAAFFFLLPGAHSELTDAQKRALFLQSREDIRPVPRATTTPRPRPAPAPRATPRATPHAPPRATPEEDDEPPKKATPTPHPHPKATPPEDEPDAPAKPRPTPTPTEQATPPPRATPVPKATPEPTVDKKAEERASAPIVIQKSGLAEDEGEIPPPPKRGWSLFGGGPKFTYLTPSVRAAIDRARVKRGRWKYIVVHNSGTRQGNAKAFDAYHRNVRHMPNGLAYHFVIGNGHSSGDGEIEIGNRWTQQINGGHVASDYLNNIALGICLVGDLNRDVPTKAQTLALRELINYLRTRCGRVQGKIIIVRGHKQINPKPTDCPGDRFPLKWLNREFHD
jgi:hypothetical protein